MNKNIKKIIPLALTLSFVPALIPNSLDLWATPVYAASSSGYITDISVETNKNKTVNVYTKSSYNSNYKLSKLDNDEKVPTDLYAEVASNTNKIKITDIDLGTNCDSFKIYKGSTEIDLDEEVNISSTLKLKIEAYSGTTLKDTYTIRIEKKDDDEDEDADNLYLSALSLKYDSDKIDLDFNKNTSSYELTVNNKTTYVKISAEPEDNNNIVKIDGTPVDDDDWTKKVILSEGLNTIPIRVIDDNNDNDDSIYTLKITRASETTSSTSSTVTNNLKSSLTGAPGWQKSNGVWYFIGPDASKQIGWLKDNGNWYYMNEKGIMQTGWLQSEYNGLWYYLEVNGAMVTNTTIDGHKIGNDGTRA